MADDQEEMGLREKLEQERAAAHREAARLRRKYYSDHNLVAYAMADARGKPLNDENDPLLARLEAGLR